MIQQMSLKDIMLCEINQIKTNTIWYYLYMDIKRGKKKKGKLIVVPWDWGPGGGGGEEREVDKRVQSFRFKILL